MKKVIALALALVMVLGLAVSAFAVILEKETKDPVDVTTIDAAELTAKGNLIITDGKKTTKYVTIDTAYKTGSLKVEATGCATAEIVKLDGKVEDIKYVGEDLVNYLVYCKADVKDASGNVVFARGLYTDGDSYYGINRLMPNGKFGTGNALSVKTNTNFTDALTYASATDLADALNEEYDTDKFVVRNDGNLPTVVKIVVEDNYTAAYKEGKVVISAIDATDKKTVIKNTIKVISDVCIFAYEDVKDAAEDETVLDGDFDGYSDYLTAKKGYKTSDLSEVAKYDNPTVVSTTAFRAIAGKGISYEDGALSVEIPVVAEGQKGVNFKTGYKDTYVTAAGKEVVNPTTVADTDKLKSFEFGFKGNQVIASDFTVTLTLDADKDDAWFELREAFKEKVEENDIITYYVLKDGKLYDKVTVDYKDLDLDTDEIEIVINGKAGDTLGWYTVQLTAPAEETEENPNTGAETMVGAVIALAVVSVASAAAVSLKK